MAHRHSGTDLGFPDDAVSCLWLVALSPLRPDVAPVSDGPPERSRMSAMSDQPVTLSVLAQFHREVILPDIERVVAGLVNGRFDAIDDHFDAVYHRFERLETDYVSMKAGVKRLEEGLERVE